MSSPFLNLSQTFSVFFYMWLPGIPHPSNLSSIRCQEVHPDGQEDWSEKWEDEDWSEKSEADEVIDDEIEQAIEQELSKDPLPTGWMSAKKATPSGGISAKKDPPMVKARSSGADSTSAKSMAASSSGLHRSTARAKACRLCQTDSVDEARSSSGCWLGARLRRSLVL